MMAVYRDEIYATMTERLIVLNTQHSAMGMVTRTELHEAIGDLIKTAGGITKADLVVEGGALLNVFTRELLEDVDVAVKGQRIALVGNADHTVADSTRVIRARGRVLVPGFLDGHVHIESSMLTVTQFAKVVLPHGTTSVFIDPHEIANVLGMDGVKLMHDEGLEIPLKVFVAIPSCVPATSPELETAGASIGPEDISWAFSNLRNAVALGEVMNYAGVISGESKMLDEITRALSSKKVVEGHFYGDLNRELNAYVAAGVSSSHESTTKLVGLSKLRLGMHVMIREGSAWRDLKEVIRCITETRLDSRRVCLVSDDREAEHLVREGHMDHIVRRAIEEGVDPIRAVQMATINTAEHFKVDHEVGAIAPGRLADILILDDLSRVRVNEVIADGKLIAKNGTLVTELRGRTYPSWSMNTIKLRRPIDPQDLQVKTSLEEVVIRVMEVIEGSVVTKHKVEEVRATENEIRADVNRDLLKTAVFERHKMTGNYGVGFVRGFGLKAGAVASTVAHDSHNLLIVGTNDEDMAYAGNYLASIGGGMTAVRGGRVLATVPLPIAGLMSDREAEEVSEHVRKLGNAWRELGCTIMHPFMTMSLLSLPVLPELRLTDRGLIDTVEFRRVDLIVS